MQELYAAFDEYRKAVREEEDARRECHELGVG